MPQAVEGKAGLLARLSGATGVFVDWPETRLWAPCVGEEEEEDVPPAMLDEETRGRARKVLLRTQFKQWNSLPRDGRPIA